MVGWLRWRAERGARLGREQADDRRIRARRGEQLDRRAWVAIASGIDDRRDVLGQVTARIEEVGQDQDGVAASTDDLVDRRADVGLRQLEEGGDDRHGQLLLQRGRSGAVGVVRSNRPAAVGHHHHCPGHRGNATGAAGLLVDDEGERAGQVPVPVGGEGDVGRGGAGGQRGADVEAIEVEAEQVRGLRIAGTAA